MGLRLRRNPPRYLYCSTHALVEDQALSINAWSVGLLDFPTTVLLERVQHAEDPTAEALASGLDRSLSALGSDARRHRIMRVRLRCVFL